MNADLERGTLSGLERIDDAHAATLVSSEALTELGEAIVEIPPLPAHRGRRRRRERRTFSRPAAALVAVAALAAGGVGVAVVAGSGPTVASPADAAIVRGALAALAHPAGTIIVESYTGDTRVNPSLTSIDLPRGWPRSRIVNDRSSGSELDEIPARQNEPGSYLNLGGTGMPAGEQAGTFGGVDELYIRADNTVYLTNAYGHLITRGPRPGTFTYTQPRVPHLHGSWNAHVNAHLPARLIITAAQARALRAGTATVQQEPGHGLLPWRLKVEPPVQGALAFTDPAASIQWHLEAGDLRVAGRTTVDDHAAIRLVARHGPGITEDDVSPTTYAPLRTITGNRGSMNIITYREYRTLPITPRNERLLELTARHPHARVVHSDRAYLGAQG